MKGRTLLGMGEYIDIDGRPTWVDERGRGGETILLLHGGLSNTELMFDTIGGPLAEHHRVVGFDRRGHGRTADTPAPFHYDDMATETIAVLERVVGGPAHLVGWSDGGIVALLVALRRPDLVGSIVPIGANYHHDGIGPMELDPSSPVAGLIAEGYGALSPDGPEHFDEVLSKALMMFTTEPTLTTDDLGRIESRALVMAGDDEFVHLDHTCSMYLALPAAQLAIVPGASHGLPLEKPAEVVHLVLDFVAADGPPQTVMPVRRRQPTTA
jgi:pimeloyl-ACP methyl ester carboxylesterase